MFRGLLLNLKDSFLISFFIKSKIMKDIYSFTKNKNKQKSRCDILCVKNDVFKRNGNNHNLKLFEKKDLTANLTINKVKNIQLTLLENLDDDGEYFYEQLIKPHCYLHDHTNIDCLPLVFKEDFVTELLIKIFKNYTTIKCDEHDLLEFLIYNRIDLKYESFTGLIYDNLLKNMFLNNEYKNYDEFCNSNFFYFFNFLKQKDRTFLNQEKFDKLIKVYINSTIPYGSMNYTDIRRILPNNLTINYELKKMLVKEQLLNKFGNLFIKFNENVPVEEIINSEFIKNLIRISRK